MRLDVHALELFMVPKVIGTVTISAVKKVTNSGAYRHYFMKKTIFVDILNRKQKIQLNHDEPRLQSGMLSREPQADCRRERQAAGFHPSVTTFQV